MSTPDAGASQDAMADDWAAALAESEAGNRQSQAAANLFQPLAASAAGAPRDEIDLVLDIPKVEEDPARKQKEIEQLKKNIANSERQLNDPVFMSKAPAKVIDTIRAKLADYKAQLEKLL